METYLIDESEGTINDDDGAYGKIAWHWKGRDKCPEGNRRGWDSSCSDGR